MKKGVMEAKSGLMTLNPAEIKMQIEKLEERISSLRRCL